MVAFYFLYWLLSLEDRHKDKLGKYLVYKLLLKPQKWKSSLNEVLVGKVPQTFVDFSRVVAFLLTFLNLFVLVSQQNSETLQTKRIICC